MNNEASLSDEYLIELAQNGNGAAYDKLFERYQYKIQQMIYFYINDSANVNDLTQEVLIKVFRYLPFFNERSQFSTWLYKITQNTIKNYFRSYNLRADSETQYVDEQFSSQSNSPESDMIGLEFEKQLEEAISGLSEELRLCYGMHIFDGQTYQDIAKEMHCPIGTVRSRIFRARKQLIELIGDHVHQLDKP
ncbi:RNA polymerase sigma factor [Legionella norrlandica]|uniref:RNA polymerase sigma factor n=1 Tax=Legionella norrlandica TaxID=1498499 RepID=A0A0A2SWR2_9GAMM|nr:sigma-70 family RNA polymerase sigma factor [Legionella norrlandica]KGP63854.1 RNA polymerase sigma factor [Legionella norrlandica]